MSLSSRLHDFRRIRKRATRPHTLQGGQMVVRWCKFLILTPAKFGRAKKVTANSTPALAIQKLLDLCQPLCGRQASTNLSGRVPPLAPAPSLSEHRGGAFKLSCVAFCSFSIHCLELSHFPKRCLHKGGGMHRRRSPVPTGQDRCVPTQTAACAVGVD